MVELLPDSDDISDECFLVIQLVDSRQVTQGSGIRACRLHTGQTDSAISRLDLDGT